MDQKALEKQVVDLTALVKGQQKSIQSLQVQIQQLKVQNRHIKARIEAMGHNVTNVARMIRKD
jgi:septal ring factor EnvC (AmiA/AmiB activator)